MLPDILPCRKAQIMKYVRSSFTAEGERQKEQKERQRESERARKQKQKQREIERERERAKRKVELGSACPRKVIACVDCFSTLFGPRLLRSLHLGWSHISCIEDARVPARGAGYEG